MASTSQRIDVDRLRRTVSLLSLLPDDAGARRIGVDAYLARCSFHADRTPSMRVALTDGGWAYFCYACGAKGDAIRYVMETRRLPFLDAVRAMGGTVPPPVTRHLSAIKDHDHTVPSRAGKPPGRIVATYDYFDELGVLLYQVVRLEPKSFRQRQPHAFSGWRWTMEGARRVLYRLPDLTAAGRNRTVFIVEGEKDADALAATGRIATTNVGGAGKWRPEYTETLRGRKVVILPDNDEPGRKHADQVRAALQGIAASVRVQVIPGPSKDVSDWLEQNSRRTEARPTQR